MDGSCIASGRHLEREWCMSIVLLALLATGPTNHEARALAQVEKQALKIQEIALRMQEQTKATREAGRPVGLALLQSDLAELESHINRLEKALGELQDKIDAQP